jgi:hypothetical protein
VLTSEGLSPSVLLAWSEFGGQVFDGFTVDQVFSNYLVDVVLRGAQVPGTSGIDDKVRTVFAEPEAVYGVDADVPVHVLGAQLVLQRAADGFRTTFLAVASLADQHVGVVVADLRVGLFEDGERAVLLRALSGLLASLRDGVLRF